MVAPLLVSSVVFGICHAMLLMDPSSQDWSGIKLAQSTLHQIGNSEVASTISSNPSKLALIAPPPSMDRIPVDEIAKILASGAKEGTRVAEKGKRVLFRMLHSPTHKVRVDNRLREGTGLVEVENVGFWDPSVPTLAPAVYFSGIATSLLNHGYPGSWGLRGKQFVSDFDRATIGLCGAYDTFLAWSESSDLRRGLLLGIQYSAVRSFVEAKRLGGRASVGGKAVFFHASAHALCTLHHAIVLKGVGKDWGNDWGERVREYGEHRGGVIGNVLKDFHSPFENRVFKGLVFGAVGTNIALTTKRAWQF
jgi:hypothetical protein